MNTLDVLKYGHLTLMSSLENISVADWAIDGVCGVWSVKDIVAHLASFEQWHLEVLNGVLGVSAPTPIFDSRREYGDAFNDVEVEKRANLDPQETLDEYIKAQAEVVEFAGQVPALDWVENGSIPWYGLEYCLNDFFVYTSYGHKREHSAQVNVFRDQLAA